MIARDSGEGEQASGQGKQAGDKAGKDYYEAEVTIAELESVLFKEMELPNLQQKEQANIITDKVEFNDIRKKGLMGNIDKKRTIMTAIKRNAIVQFYAPKRLLALL